jgi:hypothetical protein
MKERSALLLAIIAIVFIHATNKSENKNPVDKKMKNEEGNDRRNLQNKQIAHPVAAYASHAVSANSIDVFHNQFKWQNRNTNNQASKTIIGNSKNHPVTAGTVLSYDPSYLFYYQRIKFSKGLSANMK